MTVHQDGGADNQGREHALTVSSYPAVARRNSSSRSRRRPRTFRIRMHRPRRLHRPELERNASDCSRLYTPPSARRWLLTPSRLGWLEFLQHTLLSNRNYCEDETSRSGVADRLVETVELGRESGEADCHSADFMLSPFVSLQRGAACRPQHSAVAQGRHRPQG